MLRLFHSYDYNSFVMFSRYQSVSGLTDVQQRARGCLVAVFASVSDNHLEFRFLLYRSHRAFKLMTGDSADGC